MKSGNDFYHLEYLDVVQNEDVPALPTSARKLIQRAIEERLTVDPIGFGKPLRYSLKGHRRLRVSHYRVIYRIEPETKTVLIVAIKHRKNVYEG